MTSNVEKKLDNFIKYNLLKEKEPKYYIGFNPASELIYLLLFSMSYFYLMFYLNGDVTFLRPLQNIMDILVPIISLFLGLAVLDFGILIYRYSKWSKARKELLEEIRNEIE